MGHIGDGAHGQWGTWVIATRKYLPGTAGTNFSEFVGNYVDQVIWIIF